jgi:hypothetical protein
MDNRLKLILKAAAVMLTAPATIEVAADAYADNILFRAMVTLGMLVVVEGALLLGWHKLDTDRTAASAQRWLYAGIAIVAYVVLWLVALGHNEGGLIWGRATLGVLLVYSIAESGILADITLNTDGARNILNDLQVKMHDRKLSRIEAKAERSAMSAVRLAFIAAEQNGGLHAAGLRAERIQALNDASHASDTTTTHATATPALPPKWDGWVTASKDDTKAQIATLLQNEPGISTYALAKRLDKSETTIRRYRKELEAESAAPVVSANGHGAAVPNP